MADKRNSKSRRKDHEDEEMKKYSTSEEELWNDELK